MLQLLKMSEKNFQKVFENLKVSTTQMENVLKDFIGCARDLVEICGTNNTNPGCDIFSSCQYIQEHLQEISTHLKQIKKHEEKIRESDSNLKTTEVSKRNSSQTSLHLRKTRTSSMKYLVQWEKVMEAQNAENSNVDEDMPLLPKPVIKKRVKQFEGSHKKRVSSTVEAFLDGPDRKTIIKEDDLIEEDDETDKEDGKEIRQNDVEGASKQEEITAKKNQLTQNDGSSYYTLSKDGISQENAKKLKPRIVGVIVSTIFSFVLLM